MATLLTNIRDHLVSAEVVRRPREATPAGKPPCWLEPREGVPAPGEGQNATEIGADAVVGVFHTGGIPARPFESFYRTDIVDFWLRTRNHALAHALERAIRGALIDKRNWTMGSQQVIESKQWRALQRLGSDQQGYTFLTAYLFEIYADY